MSLRVAAGDGAGDNVNVVTLCECVGTQVCGGRRAGEDIPLPSARDSSCSPSGQSATLL